MGLTMEFLQERSAHASTGDYDKDFADYTNDQIDARSDESPEDAFLRAVEAAQISGHADGAEFGWGGREEDEREEMRRTTQSGFRLPVIRTPQRSL